MSAHGITDAFIGAELLSDALFAEGADADAALGGYQQQRDEFAAMLMPPVAALARLDLDPSRATPVHVALSPAIPG